MNILISEFTGLGNSIMIVPLIYNLNKKLPTAKITLIGDNRYGGLDIFRYDQKIYEIINYKNLNFFQKIKFFFFINKYNFLLVSAESGINIILFFLLNFFFKNKIIITENLFKSYLYKIKLINRIIFFVSLKIRSIFKKEINIIKLDKDLHEVQANLLLGKFISREIEIRETGYGNFNYYYNRTILKKLNLKENEYVCIQPLCSSGLKTTKNWGLDKFQTLIKNNFFDNFKIVFLGDKIEKEIVGNFFKTEKIVNLLGLTNLDDLINLIKFTKFTICHDSGILHLSELLNKKSISIWGPTYLKKSGPISKNGSYVYNSQSCSPCWGTFGDQISDIEAYERCENNFACMKKITPEHVIQIIKKNIK